MKSNAVLSQLIVIIFCVMLADAKRTRNASRIIEHLQAPRFNNPNYVRDRCKTELSKPEVSESYKSRHRKPFNPGWLDYCDPYHCNDYHKNACGLNRQSMKFRWFQSGCHLILNNHCASFRGNLQYDLVDPKLCTRYVKHLRAGCPSVCYDTEPVCSISNRDNNLVLFRSRCAMDMGNCRTDIYEYEEINMSICDEYIDFTDEWK